MVVFVGRVIFDSDACLCDAFWCFLHVARPEQSGFVSVLIRFAVGVVRAFVAVFAAFYP
jgi:hypothetical protein